MFFDSVDQIREIAARNGTSIFVLPTATPVELKGALVLEPQEKSQITIEQVRDLLAKLGLKQQKDQFVVIRPAEKLGLEAANALLKSLEEPGEYVHFVLLCSGLSKLLPTIISRSAVYYLRQEETFSADIEANEKIKLLAKRLITAKPADLVEIMQEITKSKAGVREQALDVLGVAIEMLYKSYFLTGKEVFIKKIPKFLLAHQNISKNGNIKLHLVADLC